jgi:hypothetical protein
MGEAAMPLKIPTVRRRLVIGDVLRHFELGLRVFQVRRDAGGAKGVVADPGLNAYGTGAALDHGEKKPFRVPDDAGGDFGVN